MDILYPYVPDFLALLGKPNPRPGLQCSATLRWLQAIHREVAGVVVHLMVERTIEEAEGALVLDKDHAGNVVEVAIGDR